MKLAVLTASFLPRVGGAEVFAFNIARQLAESSNEVDVYIPREDFLRLSPKFRALVRPLPWKFFGIVRRAPYLGLLVARRYLRQRQREEQYDGWLVVRTFPTGYVGECLSGTVPIVLRASGEDVQKSSELSYGLRLDRTREAKISRSVRSYDRVVAMTETARADFLELGASADAIVSIPNGVDIERFATRRDIGQIRAELGWPDDCPIILTTGRNHPKKGFDLIPLIADRLREQRLQFHWYIVGRRVHNLDHEIRSRGLEDHIFTLDEVGVDLSNEADWGFPDRTMVAMYQAADVYAFPTLLENFALVLPEAMAGGAAVVTTDAPGCGDVITHERNGLQARAGDVDHFALQLERVLRDTVLRASLVCNAGEAVKAWSWSNVAKQYENLFRSLIDSRSDECHQEADSHGGLDSTG